MNEPENPAAREKLADDEATAFHEAGHAVVSLALDRPVVKVSILPGRDRAGICHFGKAVVRPTEDWIEREMLISLAGLAAEARRTGTYDRAAAGRDLQYARSISSGRSGNARQADRLERRMLSRVENLLDDEATWQAVERIAAELLLKGEISGRQARHIYEECVRE